MIRDATVSDIEQLVSIENSCFETDRMSRRSFRHMLTRAHADILVDVREQQIVGYVLLLYHRGTSLARLYSIAVLPSARGAGVAQGLVEASEERVLAHECVSLRLEIRVDNTASIKLFSNLGYRRFGHYSKYYEDDTDAFRYEKRLSGEVPATLRKVPHYQQTLDFTCGPASLMMAMAALAPGLELTRSLELKLWRESTAVFMTSGHGGCGPYGMALAVLRRGFPVEVYVKEGEPLFVDSVRSEEKKEVIRLVELDFLSEIEEQKIPLINFRLTIADMITAMEAGGIPIMLISSYRIYREKFPHWVVVTGYDEHFVYVHDPFVDEEKDKSVTDCLNMPIPRHEFERMTRYGKSGQRAALIVYAKQGKGE